MRMARAKYHFFAFRAVLSAPYAIGKLCNRAQFATIHFQPDQRGIGAHLFRRFARALSMAKRCDTFKYGGNGMIKHGRLPPALFHCAQPAASARSISGSAISAISARQSRARRAYRPKPALLSCVHLHQIHQNNRTRAAKSQFHRPAGGVPRHFDEG